MLQRLFPLLLLLLTSTAAFAQTADTDGDGVADDVDLCPTEDASSFDADGDGCLDDPRGARHIEYWDPAELPLVYVIHSSGAPGIADGSEFGAIDDAFAAWTTAPGVQLSAVNGGTTDDAQADGMDGVHQVTWSDTSFDFGSAVLAVGITTSFTEPTNFLGRDVRPGQIVDADILFNPNKTFRTSTAGRTTGADIQATATHEAGHLFGLAHSAVETATMFYVLPPSTNARSLETDDALAIFKAYPDPTDLAAATRLEGSVHDVDGNPVPGAAVFLVSADTPDTAGSEYTLPDGSFTFVGADPGNYTVSIHPLDGTSGIKYMVPDFINALVADTAVDLFVPESWNAGESSTDDPAAADVVTLAAGQVVTGIDIVTNVDQLPPAVVEQIPGEGDGDVGIDAAVLISFDESIDDGTIQGNFSLRDGDGNFVSGLASVFSDDRVLSFTPNTALQFGTDYTLTLGSGLSDRFGNALGADQSVSFTTEVEPDVSLTSLVPSRGVAGTSVVINGRGFDAATLDNNAVLFDGVPAEVTSVSASRVIATVPSAVEVGNYQITVTVSGSGTSNDLGFTVLSLTEIARGTDVGVANLAGSPRALTLKQDGSLAYVATDAGVSTVVIDAGLQSYLSSDPIPQLSDEIDDIDITPDGRRVYAVSRTAQRLHWIDSDATSANFNEVLDTIALSEAPLGIAVEPTGRRAFLAMTDGSVQVWDVQFESATFNRQIGEIESVSGGPVGSMAFDPTNELLLIPTGGGTLAIYGLRELALLDEVTVGQDPRKVAVDPAGQLAYVTDGTGLVSVVSLGDLAEAAASAQAPASPAFKVQDIELSGSAGGVAITPAALFAYVTNREQDQVEVVDLDPSSSTFRTSAAEIPTGANPVEAALSLDANYLFTLVEGADQLQVTAIGFGPVLRSVHPLFVQPGDFVAISGSAFSPVDCQTTVCPPGDYDRIWFGDIEATQFEAVGDAYLNVRVPEGFTGGPVRVQVINGGPPEAPDPFSNSIFVRALQPGAPFVPGSTEGMNLSVRMDADTGYDFYDGQDQSLTNVAEVSPNGEIVVLGGFGTLWLLDGRTTSGTYNQVLAQVPLSLNERVQDVAITPDGSRAYVSLAPAFDPSVIEIVDVNPNSPTFATILGQVDLSPITICFGAGGLNMHPTGAYLFAEDDCNDGIVVIDLTPGSLNENRVIETPPSFAFNINSAFHPGGSYLYLVSTNNDINIVNTNPLSAGWPEANDSFPVDVAYGMTPHAVAFTPDGSRALVIAATPNLDDNKFDDYYFLTLDTTQAHNPSELYPPLLIQAQVERLQPAAAEVEVSPRGHRAIVSLARSGVQAFDITSYPYVPLGSSLSGQGQSDADAGLAITPDGDRAYYVERQSANVGYPAAQLLNFLSFLELEVLSGDQQTGVAGQPLPAPVRIQASVYEDTERLPLSGAVVQVTAYNGGTLPNGLSTQIFSSDEDGIVEVEWTLGPDPDADPNSPQNSMSIYAGQVSDASPLLLQAVALEDPDDVPLNFVQILPADQATGVSATSSVQAIFSRAVDRDTATLSAFFVHPEANVEPVPAIIGLTDEDRRVSLTPTSPLAYDTAYDVEITGDLVDVDANALTNPTTTSFTTSAPPALQLSSVSPPSAAVGIELVLGGRGFAASAAENVVYFNDVAATPSEAGVDYLRVSVPASAVTGTIHVEANGQVSGSLPFTVLVPNTSPLDEVIASVGTGSTTKGVALTADGTRAYTLSPDANLVIPIDIETFETGDGISVGSDPVSIDLHPNGNLAYVANFGSNNVSVIDIDPASTTFEQVVSTIRTGNSPIDLSVSPRGDNVFVALAAETFFDMIDCDETSATFNTVVASVGTGSKTKAVSLDPDGTRAFFGTSVGYFIVTEPAFDTVVASVGSGKSTKSLTISPDGTLLIALTTTGIVDIYDVNESSAAFNQVVASVGSGSKTKSINLSPDGTLLYLIQDGSDDILVYSLEILGGVSVVEAASTPPTRVALSLLKSLDFGPDPSVIGFDPSGSGLAVVATSGDRMLTLINTGNVPRGAIATAIEVTPRTLNLSSNGRYVTGSIQLPLGLFPQQIDVGTVILYSDDPQESVPAEPEKTSIEDTNLDGIDELVVKFSREDFQRIMPEGDQVPVFIQGQLVDGRSFLGEDAIRTKRPKVLFPHGGEQLLAGESVAVSWQSPSGVQVDAVDVHFTPDGGETWQSIAVGIADAGLVMWAVPNVYTSDARVLVSLVENGEEIGSGLSPEPFAIAEHPVAVALQSVQASIEGGSAVLRWQALTGDGLQGFHVLRGETEGGAYEQITQAPVAPGPDGFVFEDHDLRGNRTYFYMLEEAWPGGAGLRHGPFKVSNVVSNALEQNYPNAFNPKTNIRFSVAQRGPVRLVVYNLAGRRVKTLVDEVLDADNYRIEWSGRDDRGSEVSSGVYLYRLETEGFVATRKMTLVR